MKLAGVKLDFYDDLDGEVLKRTFPTPESLPEAIKVAHILSPEERTVLRDEAYALVMANEGKIFRKFACVDPGNTILSVMYFLENKDALPEEAQKVACANLIQACEAFDLPVPVLLKSAAVRSGMVRKRDSFRQPEVGTEADWNQRTNLQSVSGTRDSGTVMDTASKMKTGGIVDVSGLEPKMQIKKASASRYALGDRYSLDSYADVKKAIDFFNDNYVEMSPEDRHEFSVKTASRASELGVEIPELMERYGSMEYATDVDAHIANRIALAPEFKENYNLLLSKQASIAPEMFAPLLAAQDEDAGLHWYYGGELADPYYATFGGNSEKEKQLSWFWESRVGDKVNYDQLQSLVKKGSPILHEKFSPDLVQGLSLHPIQVFESLPDDTKTIIAKMANEFEV